MTAFVAAFLSDFQVSPEFLLSFWPPRVLYDFDIGRNCWFSSLPISNAEVRFCEFNLRLDVRSCTPGSGRWGRLELRLIEVDWRLLEVRSGGVSSSKDCPSSLQTNLMNEVLRQQKLKPRQETIDRVAVLFSTGCDGNRFILIRIPSLYSVLITIATRCG